MVRVADDKGRLPPRPLFLPYRNGYGFKGHSHVRNAARTLRSANI